VLVDFADCGFLDSSGLSALVAAREQATDAGTALVLTGVSRALVRTLQATGLTPLFERHPTATEAIAALTDESRMS
jgi:anti-anti-sigma factor